MIQWLRSIFSFWKRPQLPPPAVLFQDIDPEPEQSPPELEPEPAPQPQPEPAPEFPPCEGCGRPYDPRIRARMKLRKLAKARRLAADQINQILKSMGKLDLSHGHQWGASREARCLEQLAGCDFYLVDDELAQESEALHPGDKWSCFDPNQDGIAKDLSDISWPIDRGIVTIRNEKDPEDEPGFLFQRVRTVTHEEARGHASMFVEKMVRFTYLKIKEDGNWYADDNIAGWINGRWRYLDRKMEHRHYRGGYILVEKMRDSTKIRNEIHDIVSTVQSIALSQRYSWHVALGLKIDGPRVLLATNPTGCLQFFKNREKASGKKRRDALRHWVARHYRERADAGTYYVRDHLRGQTEFLWSDLECEIFVSAFDLEKNEAFKNEAELWRSQRKHNSVRVRLKRKSA